MQQNKDWGESFHIITEIPANLECWGDARQIKQIFLNLIENARNAMQQTGGVITVSAEEINEDDKEKTLLQITDTGPGIDQKHRGQIFEPFFTTRENGTGLGLAIVRQLVESHGGEIRLEENERQSGATFRFTLPLP